MNHEYHFKIISYDFIITNEDYIINILCDKIHLCKVFKQYFHYSNDINSWHCRMNQIYLFVFYMIKNRFNYDYDINGLQFLKFELWEFSGYLFTKNWRNKEPNYRKLKWPFICVAVYIIYIIFSHFHSWIHYIFNAWCILSVRKKYVPEFRLCT